MLANSLFQGMIGRLAKLPTAWPPVPVEVAVRLEAFIRAMAEKVAEDALVDATTERIEALILANSGDDAGASTMGGTRLLRCDLDEPWIDSTNGSSTRRLLIEYQADGERLGSAVLPAIDGALPAVVIADALVAEFSWELLRRFFGRTVYQEIDTERRGDATIFSRAGAPVVHLNGEVNVDGIDALHAAIGWPVFLQELWDCRGWPVERFYKRPSRRLRRPEPSRWEIRDDGSSIAVEIALDLPRILTSFRDVDIDVTLGGIPVLSLRVGAARGAVWPDQLRRIIMDAGRFEICRLAVREALVLGDWPDRVPLRDRLAQLAQRRGYVPRAHNRAPELWDSLIREMSAPGLGAILVGRRPGANVHGTGNRTRLIPRESINVVVEAARAGGQEVVNTGGSQPSALALRAPFMFQSGEQLVPAESDDGLLARFRRRSGPPREQADDRRYSDRLPILMYHRIAESASTTTRRWVTTPAEFEQQLAFLSEHEYGPIDIEEWADAISLNVGVRGKRVLITFDDGDEDFATSAVPLLERYGLCAELFVPCDHVGGTNAWSAGSGERIHLMGWDTLRQMPPHVVKVGSHGASHRPLAALALADAMDELVRSRAALEDELGREVISLAYPSGSADGAVAYLAGAAGYEFAYTTEPWRAYPDSDRLRLPRLEVRGGQTIEEFAQMLSGF
jgi:peptidoglycan/xylan/chitin deacetylase (PgdA/CDA1 family)